MPNHCSITSMNFRHLCLYFITQFLVLSASAIFSLVNSVIHISYHPILLKGHTFWRQRTTHQFLQFFLNLFRERESMWAGEGQRERERRQRIPSRLSTVSAEPHTGLDPMNCEITTWAEVKSWMLNWLSHPGASSIFAVSESYPPSCSAGLDSHQTKAHSLSFTPPHKTVGISHFSSFS